MIDKTLKFIPIVFTLSELSSMVRKSSGYLRELTHNGKLISTRAGRHIYVSIFAANLFLQSYRNEIISLHQAAGRWGIEPEKIEAMCQSGEIVSVFVNGTYFMDVNEIFYRKLEPSNYNLDPLTPSIYTTEEAAEYLNMSKQYVKMLCQREEIISFKVGRNNFMTQLALDIYLLNKKRVS